MAVPWMDPPECAPVSEENPELAWRIFADDGRTVINRVTSRTCFVGYVCWMHMYYFFTDQTNITARLEPPGMIDPWAPDPIEPPEDPPVEPDPV